ncbi:MAG: homoserine dehydrogenase, partial [Peptococcaceae bacterium]|nr:homoserine dehydrogenase [Peptococcaceae bacterium]
MNKVVIGLLGYGTVGSGVASILRTNRFDINCRTHADLTIKKALVRNLR